MINLLVKHKIAIPPMTKATLGFSAFIQNNWFWLLAVFLAPIILFINWVKSEKGRYFFDQILIQMPILGSTLQRTSIEIFCRVFYSLYSSSGENISAIRIAAKSCRNKYIEKQI